MKNASNETTSSNYSTFEATVIEKLTVITEKLDDLNEKVEAIEVRLADMDLDTGGGFEID